MKTSITDCFMYFNEDSVCLMRLHYLSNIVDSFLILEGNRTFTGEIRKPQFQERILSQLSASPEILEKIQYEVVDMSGLYETNTPWNAERFLRNSASKYLDASRNVTICSDCDEVPSIKWISEIRAAFNNAIDEQLLTESSFDSPSMSTIYASEMLMFYGHSRNLMFCKDHIPVKWKGQFAALNLVLKNICIDSVRAKIMMGNSVVHDDNTSLKVHIFPSGGWHLSYFGSEDAFTDKIKSFSHQEDCIQSHRGNAFNSARIGQDPFMREYHFRLPLPEELFPPPKQVYLEKGLGYPSFDNSYMILATNQRLLETSILTCNTLITVQQSLSRCEQIKTEAEKAKVAAKVLSETLSMIEESFFWKATQPFRAAVDILKKIRRRLVFI